MAKIGLFDNPKFRRLVRKLGLPRPYVRGLLETMWESGWQRVTPVLGDSLDVELSAEWPGDVGVFFSAIKDDWLDEIEVGVFSIHDFWDHAPPYVHKRYDREQANLRKVREKHYIKENGSRPADNGVRTADIGVPSGPDRTGPDRSDPVLVGPVSASPEAIGKHLANDAEIERRLSRYMLDPEADESDKQLLRHVLSFVTSERVTGKPLPFRQRIRILDQFAHLPTSVVYLACHTFIRDGCIESGKGDKYLLGICNGSATSEAIERKNESDRVKHGIQLRSTETRVESANPKAIRELLVPGMRQR